MGNSIAFKQVGFTTGRRRIYKVFNIYQKQEYLTGSTFKWEMSKTMAKRNRHCSVDENGNQITCHDDHNQLRSLQGGIEGEYYHLTFAQYDIVRNLQDNEFEQESGVNELDAVYFKTNGRIEKANNALTDNEARVIGIVKQIDCFAKLYRPGEVVSQLSDIDVTLDPGKLVFLDSTPGRYTSVEPISGLRVPIGVAITTDSFWFWPNLDDIT